MAAERLATWCSRLPSPAPDMLRVLAARGTEFMTAENVAATLAKKPTGGHWDAELAVLRNNDTRQRVTVVQFFVRGKGGNHVL